MGLSDTLRTWLILEKIGLLNREEITRRVDEIIVEMEDPPDYPFT